MQAHPSSPNPSIFYHLDEVNCDGNEGNLSECYHSGVGIHNCWLGLEDAGVICNSKCTVMKRQLVQPKSHKEMFFV